MNNKNIIFLTERETLQVQLEFFDSVYEAIQTFVEENKIEVTYDNKMNTYRVSIKNETCFPAIELMRAAQNTVNRNHNIYKKFVTYETKSNIIFTKLLAQITYYEEGTIRQQFSRHKFNDEIFDGVSKLLNIDTNILKGRNIKSLISMAYQFHGLNLDEYSAEIDEYYFNENSEYEACKIEFMSKYKELTLKEKYVLHYHFDTICSAFPFFNYIYTIFTNLNEKGQNAYNDVFSALFPDTFVESKFSVFNRSAYNNSEYSNTKSLIEKIESITEDNLNNLPLKKSEEAMSKQISNCAPIYYDIALNNLKLLLDNNSDNRRIALFFTILSEDEKELIRNNIIHLNSIPEYCDE